VLGLNKWVRKDLNLLKEISLLLKPRELVVVVGQVEAAINLVDAIAGYRPATMVRFWSTVWTSTSTLTRCATDRLVPQKDIIHTELTVYQASTMRRGCACRPTPARGAPPARDRSLAGPRLSTAKTCRSAV